MQEGSPTCFKCGGRCAVGHRLCVTCAKPKLRGVLSEKKELTSRDVQVAALVAEGLSNKLIAYKLGLSEGTIKSYLYSIFKKVDVTNRTELARWVIMKGTTCTTS